MESKINPALEPIDPERVKQLSLANGDKAPAAAYGTFHSDWAQEYMHDAIVEAIRLGWRHIDTARAYENEALVGEAIKEALRRGYIASTDELYITGKLWNGHMAVKDVASALEATLRDLGVAQIDMYLTHWPWPNVHTPGCSGGHRNPDAVPYIHEEFMATWQELQKLRRAGKVRALGVSNQTRLTMALLLRDCAADERPLVNQFELHPLFQRQELVRYFQQEKIACTGYMALGSPHRPGRDRFVEHRADMADPVIMEIAAKRGLSAGEVCLAWANQRENATMGFVAMSTSSQRMRDNLACAATTKLPPEDILQISGDGTEENPGIDANNRLIWGQVFLWPEAAGDWRILWNDSQVFATRGDYQKFKASWQAHAAVAAQTTCQLP